MGLYVYVPLALQPGCVSVRPYVYVSLASRPGCASVCLYGCVPLSSQPGCASACLFVYVELASQPGCVSVCLYVSAPLALQSGWGDAGIIQMTRRAYLHVSYRVIRGQQGASWQTRFGGQICNFWSVFGLVLRTPKFVFDEFNYLINFK